MEARGISAVAARYTCSACGGASAVEIAGVDPALTGFRRDVAIHVELAHATCPRCGARNPKGVEDQRKDRRNLRIFTYAAMVAAAAGSYYVPWIAIGYLAAMTLVIAVVAWRRPSPTVAFNLAMSVAWVVLAYYFRSYAFVLPVVALVRFALGKPDPDEIDRPWREAQAKLRFL